MTRLNLLEALTDNIKIDYDKCVFCGKCADTCILDNLRLKLSPCRQACPLGVNAQGYVQLIARGELEKAREMVLRDLPLPEIISLVCDAPCESSCHLGRTTGRPVAIRALKRFLFEGKGGEAHYAPEEKSGKKAAVVGSGPAGLTAAFDLAMAGHKVTVFEKDETLGGLLARGIPGFRLPLQVVERELGNLTNLGVEFKKGILVGGDLSLGELENSYDGVVLALGLGGQRKLGVPGDDLPGVQSGMKFLASAKSGRTPELGGRVVVIGGGNAAMDAAQTALRLGAMEVTVVSLEKEGELPAFDHEVRQCKDEGVSFNCGWGVTQIRETDGRASSLELAVCDSLFDSQGNFAPVLDLSCGAMKLKADHIIVAIGQDGSPLTDLLGAEREIDPLTLGSSRPKVFVAGDCCQGPGSAVAAMASGRRAAESLKLFFEDKPLSFNRSYAGPVVTDYEIKPRKGSGDAGLEPGKKEFGGKGDFRLLEECFSREEALKEALRCLSCGGPFGKYRTCWFCLPCEVECPEDAIWVDVPYLLR